MSKFKLENMTEEQLSNYPETTRIQIAYVIQTRQMLKVMEYAQSLEKFIDSDSVEIKKPE